MKEAMTKANFERSEKGLPPLKPVQLVRPDDVKPKMEDEISMSDIKGDAKLEFATRMSRKNDEGVSFVGFHVTIKLISKKKEPVTLKGWMVEGEFLSFARTYRTQIDQQVISW